MSLFDEDARNLTFKCTACVNNHLEKTLLKNNQNITSTPLAKEPVRDENNQHRSEDSSLSSVSEIHITSTDSSINFFKSEDNSLESDKENSENKSKIEYLKGLENKFMELAQDDSGNNESPAINEIKEIIQKVRQNIAAELSHASIALSNSSKIDHLYSEEETASNQHDSSINISPHETIKNPLKSLYSSLPYAHRESNAILEQNIQILKEENTIKNIQGVKTP